MRWNLTTTVRSMVVCLVTALPTVAAAGWFGISTNEQDNGVSPCGQCGGDCGLVCVREPQTCYSYGANLLWLGRSKVQDNPLVAVPANAPAARLLGAADMEFDVSAGIDAAFRATRPSGRSWELRYFGIFDQSARQRLVYDDGDANTTNDATIVHLGTFHGSYTDLTTDYSSDLHSGEINLWLNPWWCFEPVVGFRWMRQSESLESFVTTDFGEGASIDFVNNLYGAQIGFRTVLWEIPSRLRVEATLKGGIFANGTQLGGETRTGAVTTTTLGSSLTTTSFVGEVTISAVYQITSHFSARIGYNGLWLDRVGLAADQLDESFVAPGTVDLTTLIYQGGHFGFEYAW